MTQGTSEAPPVEYTLSGSYQGFVVTVNLRGRLDQLPRVVERLQAAGVEPAPQVRRQAAPKAEQPEPIYQPDGTPCCPWHHKPLREGRYGLYCPSRADGEHANEKGYCVFAVKE